MLRTRLLDILCDLVQQWPMGRNEIPAQVMMVIKGPQLKLDGGSSNLIFSTGEGKRKTDIIWFHKVMHSAQNAAQRHYP